MTNSSAARELLADAGDPCSNRVCQQGSYPKPARSVQVALLVIYKKHLGSCDFGTFECHRECFPIGLANTSGVGDGDVLDAVEELM